MNRVAGLESESRRGRKKFAKVGAATDRFGPEFERQSAVG